MAPVAKSHFAFMARPATVERYVAANAVTHHFLAKPSQQFPMMKTHVFGGLPVFGVFYV